MSAPRTFLSLGEINLGEINRGENCLLDCGLSTEAVRARDGKVKSRGQECPRHTFRALFRMTNDEACGDSGMTLVWFALFCLGQVLQHHGLVCAGELIQK